MDRESLNIGPISAAYMQEFGLIVHLCATVETDIKIAMAGMFGISSVEVFIFSEPYGALQLKNVAKSLSKIKLEPKTSEKFVSLLGEIGVFNRLRNDIAHCTWTKGVRKDSIRPVNMDIRSGKAKATGFDEDEGDLTLEELKAKSDKLYSLAKTLNDFLVSSGLLAATERRILMANI